MLWQFCFLSLKKSTFKLEFFFFISVQKFLPFFKFEKLTSLTFMTICRLVIKFDVFIILQEKSFYQKILQKIWPGHQSQAPCVNKESSPDHLISLSYYKRKISIKNFCKKIWPGNQSQTFCVYKESSTTSPYFFKNGIFETSPLY